MNLTFMMTLTLFMLLGMITLSTSNPESNHRNITQELQKDIVECLELPAIKNFKISTYFRSAWQLDRFYVLKFPRKNAIESLCARMTYDFSSLQPFQYTNYQGAQLFENGITFYEGRKTNYILIKKFVGKYFLCDQNKGEHRHCRTEITVLDTDYVNYSIEYSCGREGSIDLASVIKIYTRPLYTVDEKVTLSLKKFGLKLEDFKLSLNQLDPKRCSFISENSVFSDY